MKLKKLFHCLIICLTIFLISNTCIASNNWIRDEDGRAIILHGLNISNAAKRTPTQLSWHTFEDYQRMKDEWGFNCVRLLIFWSVIEPEKGMYNYSYIDQVVERINWAEELGLYVILDMHQDLYSSKFGGVGAPNWAVWDDNLAYNPSDTWWLNYIKPAVIRSFKHFWTVEELQTSYINSWIQIIQRVKNNSAIIGYDIMNEPFFGPFPPKIFEQFYLKNFYEKIIDEIRTIDQDHYIFYEPQIMASAGLKSFLPKINDEKAVYSPHFYEPTVHGGIPYFGFPYLISHTFNLRNKESEENIVPWLVGEFGVDEKTGGMDLYLIDILNQLNYHTASWTYWSYDYDTNSEFGIIDNLGNENDQLDFLIYPYPQAIAGDPIYFHYDFKERIFTMEFIETKINSPTELYIGLNRIYPEGFSINCSDPKYTWSWEYLSEKDILLLWTNKQVATHNITIKPYLQKIL